MSAPTAILAEDEAPQRRELAHMLGELWPELRIMAQCSNGLEAAAALDHHTPDVAFLDIRMPGPDGMQVARAASPRTHIVFTTAYDNFAVQAFEDGAVDYVLKPLSPERLKGTIDRLKARMSASKPLDVNTLLSMLEARAATPPERIRWISAGVGGVIRMLSVDAVLFFQSQDKYTRVVTANEEAHIRLSLKDLLPRLDPDIFWQVHRGTVVRVSAIRSVRRNEESKLQLSITGKVETLQVSSTFAGRFRSL
ncbi:MAG: response regulator transcription factor [Alphaproteobacteria bacterium]|nr:MAG: response regulator transcription factor [Alphaproteobacteria bacterium]